MSTDPFDERDDHYEDRADDLFENSPLGPEGCLFPGNCCMAGMHYESECHTPEMLMAQEGIDSNVEAVRELLKTRAEIGLQKYGVTTERTDLSRIDWLKHAQAEALDLAVYLQRLISEEENK